MKHAVTFWVHYNTFTPRHTIWLIKSTRLHTAHIQSLFYGVDMECTEIKSKFQIEVQLEDSITGWSLETAPRVQMQHLNTQASYLTCTQHNILLYFAAWQLAYYTYHDPIVYGHMVIRDVGISVLRSILDACQTTTAVCGLLQQVVDNCQSNGWY